MPSDTRVSAILENFTAQRDLFRSAVAEAAEQLRSTLSGYRNTTTDDAERAAFELGRFARGRIDPGLFALVFGEQKTIDPSAIAWIDRAEAVLQETAASIHLLQYARVTPGGSLRLTIDRSLARIGRAFGAVRVAEYARAGRVVNVEAQFLDVFPFALWNKSERKIGLPLVVEVEGADLHVAGLEEFMDGTQTIVLLVNGDAPPAALVRLITPNVTVMQTSEVERIADLASARGPAIAAVVAESCAQFAHANGALELALSAPATQTRALGRISAFQQNEELAQLRALAPRPHLAPASFPPPAPTPAPAPEDVLAAWLLRQANV